MKDPTYTAWLTGFCGNGDFTVTADGVPERIITETKRLPLAENVTVSLRYDSSLDTDGYNIICGEKSVQILGGDNAGLLYGVYAVHRQLGTGVKLSEISEQSKPVVKNRILNHWDNIDGFVERGYSGGSLFWKGNVLAYDKERITDYARLLSSVGINQICINNVNVTPQSAELITKKHLPKLKELADLLGEFYIKLIIAVEFSSPMELSGLDTCDPLDGEVAKWWQKQTALVYEYIPNLAGFLVKADSEFRTGPAALGRTQADGANVIANALKSFNGVVYWRCFVYNCMQDWRDTKTDRPKAAYEHFHPLDGKFESNVILQIKNGPTDFQVREPNSPLLGSMKNTRQAVEFQIAGEYTGQQIDLYGIAVQWEEFFKSQIDENRFMSELFGQTIDTIVAVSNTGKGNSDNVCWTGNPLAQANLYAFGRLAWDCNLTSSQITDEWARLTFENNAEIVKPVAEMILKSREVYEKYNAPLGIGWMININHHYGPSPDGYEFAKWGTYHRANHTHIGVDRTKRGTGYVTQYNAYLADMYGNIDSCPENLLLFFHRLPFEYRLKNGNTIIQHIYDTHFEGVCGVEEFIKTFGGLKELLPKKYFDIVADRFDRQHENAKEWRDVINTYFYRLTMISDEHNRKIYE